MPSWSERIIRWPEFVVRAGVAVLWGLAWLALWYLRFVAEIDWPRPAWAILVACLVIAYGLSWVPINLHRRAHRVTALTSRHPGEWRRVDPAARVLLDSYRRRPGVLGLNATELRFMPMRGGGSFVLRADEITGVRETSRLEIDTRDRGSFYFALASGRAGWVEAIADWRNAHVASSPRRVAPIESAPS